LKCLFVLRREANRRDGGADQSAIEHVSGQCIASVWNAE
jgi:hypothetical protein